MHLHPNDNRTEQTVVQRSLIDYLRLVAEPRMRRRRLHDLSEILLIGISTLLCGGETFNDMEQFGKAKLDWLKTFLTLANGIPSHDTFNRVFSAIDPEQFLECFLQWTQSLRQSISGEIVAIDGKALRRACNKGQSVKYIVSAWAESNGLVLGQLKVADKSNEITAVPELLRVLELSGCIVTIDAMGCQKKIAREIVDADADYVLALKGNQETVHEEVRSFLEDALAQKQAPRPANAPLARAAATLQCFETVEKDHGRLEIRRYYQSAELDWFADRSKWEKLTSVGMVESIRIVNDQTSSERRFYLSSLPLGVEPFARAVRSHWGVENKVHWIMDVCFREDQSRARSGYASENLATLRRFVLNLLKQDKSRKRGIRGKQLDASWDHAYLARLLSF